MRDVKNDIDKKIDEKINGTALTMRDVKKACENCPNNSINELL